MGQADNPGPPHRITPGKARLNWTDAKGDVIRQKDYGGEVVSVVVSPDGTLLASGGYDHQIHLWGVPR